MRCTACVATAKGTGAIATIEVYGPDASSVVRRTVRPEGVSEEAAGDCPMVGWVMDGSRRVDQVVAAREGANHWAIHCHGSPLVVEQIMGLLARQGVRTAGFADCLAERLVAEGLDAIGIEARLAAGAVCLEGVRLIQRQPTAGLGAWVRHWRERVGRESVERLREAARGVLERSRRAAWRWRVWRVVIAGPANVGKSTLLNALAGRAVAVVADRAGTTRDYVTVTCRMGPMVVELVDTAGLEGEAEMEGMAEPDRAAQGYARRMIGGADLVLWVVDVAAGSAGGGVMEVPPRGVTAPVILVRNKADLVGGGRPDGGGAIEPVDGDWAEAVAVSAATGAGLEELTGAIRRVVTEPSIGCDEPVVFTDRQRRLVEALAEAEDAEAAQGMLEALLNGPIG